MHKCEELCQGRSRQEDVDPVFTFHRVRTTGNDHFPVPVDRYHEKWPWKIGLSQVAKLFTYEGGVGGHIEGAKKDLAIGEICHVEVLSSLAFNQIRKFLVAYTGDPSPGTEGSCNGTDGKVDHVGVGHGYDHVR